MENIRKVRLRLLSYVIIAYMMLAFAWWSVLLFTKNQDAFMAKRDQLRLLLVADQQVNSEEEFLASSEYLSLQKQYKRQEYMILGEAIVFTISLLIGLWLINRGYKKEMDLANQQRNFLLSITHELKSPIASIQLVLETLKKRKLSTENIQQLTQNALSETTRLNTLVNNLLLSAKLEDAYQPYKETIDIGHLLEQVIQTLRSKYPNARFSYQKGSPIGQIQGDHFGLNSVFINLLENAVKYSAPDPEIDVCISQQGKQLSIEIADNGIGIADNEKARIFDKFYRIGNEDTRRTKGTGLGLYIVNQIVKAHNGKISIEDNVPQGSKFILQLIADEAVVNSNKTVNV
jgi:two-component system phosphate regulon sensor histidine kinase PhoR